MSKTVRVKRYFTPTPSGEESSDTRSTRTYEIVPSNVELGVNEIPAVVVATKYTSFLPLVRFELVAPHIETVHVHAVLVTSHVIWYLCPITVVIGEDCVSATVEPVVCVAPLVNDQFVPVHPLAKVLVVIISERTAFVNE